MNRRNAFRAVLALVCVAHLVLGIVANFAGTGFVQSTAAQAYGASVEMTPQVEHLLRILGAFMIAIGVMAGMAFVRPEAHPGIVRGIVLLLVLRVLQRVAFAGEVTETFAIPDAQLWLQSAFFLFLAAALWVLRPAGPRYAAPGS